MPACSPGEHGEREREREREGGAAFRIPRSGKARHCSLSIECKVWPVAKHNFLEVVRAGEVYGFHGNTGYSRKFIESSIDFRLVRMPRDEEHSRFAFGLSSPLFFFLLLTSLLFVFSRTKEY